ncbi:gamma-butyrobetaine hydroxylase [Marasmius fiardii PR-910]|nr:gamma-butyrobetaine hydroxylase [Marasmius fiardii PR-910]
MTVRLTSYLRAASSIRTKASNWIRPGPHRSWSSLTMGDKDLTIDTLRTSFPYVWLRDSCQGPECVHPTTTQKLHQTSDISPDVKAVAVNLEGEKGISIEWEDGHKSFFERDFLERHSSQERLHRFHKDISQKLWDRDEIARSRDLFIPYGDLGTPAGALKAMDQLLQYGLLFVRAVPNEVTDHKNCELRRLVSFFSHIRPTFYGEVWDVQNKLNSENIAYTSLNLGFHMDLLYFSNPPRYQVLHCICNNVKGGTSVFVDSFKVAYQLRDNDPSSFEVLSKTPVPFQYVLGERHYHQLHPTVQLSPTDSGIKYINYSPPFQGPLLKSTPPHFYHGLRKFDQGLQDAQNIYRHTLKAGEAVLFDNRRVLHARTAFEDIPGKEGVVNRWLIGSYFEGDDMWDKARSLRRRLC